MGIPGASQLLYFKTSPCSLSICEGQSNTRPSQEARVLTPNKRPLRWKFQPSLRTDSYAGWQGLPSTWMETPGDQLAGPAAVQGWALLLGSLWKINCFNQLINQQARLYLCFFRVFASTCDLLRWMQEKQVHLAYFTARWRETKKATGEKRRWLTQPSRSNITW